MITNITQQLKLKWQYNKHRSAINFFPSAGKPPLPLRASGPGTTKSLLPRFATIMISMISAVAENRVIGNKNALPWHMPADFKYFKEATLGKTIVMGLNTFKSIGGKPLPDRKNIILNNDPSYVPPETCFVAHSIEELLEMTKNDAELMVCGGASVYKQFLPLAQRLYITEVHASPEGDTYFPEVDLSQWNEVKRIDNKADDKNIYDYSFVVLEKK